MTIVPFSVCGVSSAAACRAVPDPEAARLVVRRVRARRHLAVALLEREPRLDVVLLRRRRAEVAGRDVHDAIREAERLQEPFLELEHPLVLVPRRLGLDEDEHLDLVELVDAEHPARVLPRRARLPAKARREARVAERELLEDLAHVQRGERHLRRTGEEEPVGLEGVDVRAVGREEARAVHRLLADEDGRDDRREAGRRQDGRVRTGRAPSRRARRRP